MRTKFCLGILLLTLSLFSHAEPTNTAITLYSDGTRLAGNLWSPEDLKPKERRPAILMIHGWRGREVSLESGLCATVCRPRLHCVDVRLHRLGRK